MFIKFLQNTNSSNEIFVKFLERNSHLDRKSHPTKLERNFKNSHQVNEAPEKDLRSLAHPPLLHDARMELLQREPLHPRGPTPGQRQARVGVRFPGQGRRGVLQEVRPWQQEVFIERTRPRDPQGEETPQEVRIKGSGGG